MRPRPGEPAYVVAEALDTRIKEWEPEEGMEDLLLYDPRYPIDVPPKGLLDIGRIAVETLTALGWTPPSSVDEGTAE